MYINFSGQKNDTNCLIKAFKWFRKKCFTLLKTFKIVLLLHVDTYLPITVDYNILDHYYNCGDWTCYMLINSVTTNNLVCYSENTTQANLEIGFTNFGIKLQILVFNMWRANTHLNCQNYHLINAIFSLMCTFLMQMPW